MPKKKTLPPPDDFSPEISETAPAEELPEQQAEAVSENTAETSPADLPEADVVSDDLNSEADIGENAPDAEYGAATEAPALIPDEVTADSEYDSILQRYDDVARPLPADEPNGTAGRLSGRNNFKEDTIMYEQTNTMMETKTSFQIPQLLDGDDFTSEDLADDMEGLRLSFTRIKIPGGGHLQFEIPSGNPDVPDYAPYLEGVILYSHNSNAYWPEGSEYDDDQPPLCQSFDGKAGYGEPGGTCADCVLNQFGSDGNNKGKACKNMRMLYLLRSGEYMPIQIALPPTSLMPYTRFVNEAFLSRRRKVCTGVVRIGLKKAVSGSHEYCVATFTKIADFAGEDLAHIRAYADGFVAQIKDINAQRAQAGAAASSIIGDGDVSHLELPDNGAHFALGAVIDGEREELPA